ncbi:MAG: DUF448 domain-containing protein [Myxococcota bacterium]
MTEIRTPNKTKRRGRKGRASKGKGAERQAQPERTCVGCRQRAPGAELLRVVVVPAALSPWSGEGPGEDKETVAIDWRGKVPGRGAWLHPDAECIARAFGRGGLNRSFRRSLWLPPQEEALEVIWQGMQARFIERLSLARRAGAVRAGEAAVQESMKLNRCRLLVLSGDTSPKQTEKYTRNAERKGLDWTQVLSGAQLGQCIRRPYAGCISVEAEPFASSLKRLARPLAALRGALAQGGKTG